MPVVELMPPHLILDVVCVDAADGGGGLVVAAAAAGRVEAAEGVGRAGEVVEEPPAGAPEQSGVVRRPETHPLVPVR